MRVELRKNKINGDYLSLFIIPESDIEDIALRVWIEKFNKKDREADILFMNYTEELPPGLAVKPDGFDEWEEAQKKKESS